MTRSELSLPLHAGPRLGDLILDALERHRDRAAILDGDRTLTYGDLGERIARALATYGALGLAPGDTVAQLSANSAELYAAMAAAYIGGYRSVTLHAMGGLEDQAFILADSQAKLLIVDAAHAERALALQARLGPAVAVLLHDAAEPLPCFWALDEGPAALPRRAVGQSEDIIRLAYTGGTTGRPKGVMLSNRALVSNTLLALASIEWPAEVRFLCPAPISHGAGSIILPTLMRGGCVILQKGFAAEGFARQLATSRATLTWLVPTMIIKLLDWLDTASADLSSLETLIYSGAPMAPAHIRQALDRLGPVMFQCYGQTEAPNTVLYLSRADHVGAGSGRLASAGRPFPGVEVAILDDLAAERPRGEVGEICVRGPLVMSGYWRQPEATAEVFAQGWLHTGDVGFVDPDGYVHIVDRKKDMVISGGFNVYPKEIEDVLLRHVAVAEAAVVGLPDPVWGEAVKALVVLRPGAQASAAELTDLVRSVKGAVHAPKSVDFVATIPVTALGKPDKKAIRASYAV